MLDDILDPGEEVIERYELGPCCACGAEGPQVRNIIMLNQKAPKPGTGWGCLVCHLPLDGAVAVVCDECLEANAEIRFVCNGRPHEGRMPIADLPFEEFDHDLFYHSRPPPGIGRPIGYPMYA